MNLKYITCSVDENYFDHLIVMLTSLFRNKKQIFYIYILISDLSIMKKSKLNIFFSKYEVHKFEIIKVENESLNNLALVNGHITLASYYRILLPKLLPKKIDKILYLDVDLIIKGNIDFFWLFSVCNYSHLAVEDIGINSLHKKRLFMDDYSKYFNAGVLLINLDWWRREKVFDKCMEFLEKYQDRIILHDQDVLNSVLCNQWEELPYAYNAQESIFRKDLPLYRSKNYLNAYFNPIIIHYTGGGHSKPWYKECRHDLKNEYAFYYYKSKMFNNPIWIRLFHIDFKLTFFTLPLVYFGRFNHQFKRLRLFLKKNNFCYEK
jgi:lipopolysaccharide biosynthesis glycosyltransferase